MSLEWAPVERTSLADDLQDRVVQLIRSGTYAPGDRLPSIMKMSRSFGVGHPTLREALRKLEAVGVVEIRHGSGVYVSRGQNALLVSNPAFQSTGSKKLLLDLIEARIAIEVRSAALAAVQAPDDALERMDVLLQEAGANLEDDTALNAANMGFHREIAEASGNLVFAQLQYLLTDLFRREQRAILHIYGSRSEDHAQHCGILDALRLRDPALAEARMQAHLEGVRKVLIAWEEERIAV